MQIFWFSSNFCPFIFTMCQSILPTADGGSNGGFLFPLMVIFFLNMGRAKNPISFYCYFSKPLGNDQSEVS